jgi:hypothetical protein
MAVVVAHKVSCRKKTGASAKKIAPRTFKLARVLCTEGRGPRPPRAMAMVHWAAVAARRTDPVARPNGG